MRLLLPKPVKKSVQGESELFLTPGIDDCLELHVKRSLEQLALQAENSPAGNRNRKSFSRLFFARAEKCELDAQSRIRIPQRLAEWAGGGGKIVILGVGTHWEIWDHQNWQNYFADHKPGFNQIAESLFGRIGQGSDGLLETRDTKEPASPRPR